MTSTEINDNNEQVSSLKNYGGSYVKRSMLASVLVLAGSLATAAGAQTPTTSNPITPKISIVFAEGLGTTVTDDGEFVPGTVTARLMVSLGWSLPSNFRVSAAVGILTPHTAFNPAPRVAIAVSYSITKDTSVNISLMYQYNPGYADKPDSHSILGGVGVLHKLVPWFAVGLDIGPGKALGPPGVGLVFQPKVVLTF